MDAAILIAVLRNLHLQLLMGKDLGLVFFSMLKKEGWILNYLIFLQILAIGTSRLLEGGTVRPMNSTIREKSKLDCLKVALYVP